MGAKVAGAKIGVPLTETGLPFASTIGMALLTMVVVPLIGASPANPMLPYCAVSVAVGSSALRVALTSMSEFSRLSASSCSSGLFANASLAASSNEGASIASGRDGISVGIISTYTKLGASGSWLKAQSAILRLLWAMRMFRVLTERPNPFSNCCWNPTKIEDCTAGLNRLAAEVEEFRVLFQKENKVVPVWKPWEYCVLKVEVCNVSLASVESPVPVPEVRGLLTGMLRSSMLRVEVMRGS